MHRLMVWVFATVLGVLLYWSIGFVIDDVGDRPGPNYEEIEARLIDPQLRQRADELRQEIETAEREEAELGKQQAVLRDSTSESQRTMNQLLEFQKLNLQKDVKPTGQEQQALAESQQLFLGNQQRYQDLNQRITDTDSRLRDLREQQRTNERALAEARPAVYDEFNRLERRNNWQIAAIKLAVLLPLLVVAVLLYLKNRGGTYAPMVYAFGLATAFQVGIVMHEYFPAIYFKYILIGTCILIVARILYGLLRMIAYPKRDWLLNQYRDAYERFLCPVCEYPIRRGPRKHLFWTRRSVRKLPLPASDPDDADTPYTCPMCSTRLFEECPACHRVRHALLPACMHCGSVKDVEPQQTMPA